MNNRYGFEDNFISKLEMKRNVGFMRGSQRGNDNGPGSSAGNSSGNSNSSGNGGNRGANSGYGGGRGLGQSQGRNAPGSGNNNRGGNNRPARPGQQRQGSLPAGWTNRGSVNPNTGRRAGDAVAGLGSRGKALVANRNRAQNAALSARGRRNQRNNALGGILGLAGLAAGGPVGLGIGLLGAGIGAFGTGKGKSTGRQLGNLADLASPIPGIGTALRAKGIADEDNSRRAFDSAYTNPHNDTANTLAARGLTAQEYGSRSGHYANALAKHNRGLTPQEYGSRSGQYANRAFAAHKANETEALARSSHMAKVGAAAVEGQRRSNIPGLVSTQKHEFNRNPGAHNQRTADAFFAGTQSPGFDPVAFAHSQNRSIVSKAPRSTNTNTPAPFGRFTDEADFNPRAIRNASQETRNLNASPDWDNVIDTGYNLAALPTLGLGGGAFVGAYKAGRTALRASGALGKARQARTTSNINRGTAGRALQQGDKATAAVANSRTAGGVARAAAFRAGKFAVKGGIAAGVIAARGHHAISTHSSDAAPKGRLDGNPNTTNPTGPGNNVSLGRNVKGNFALGAPTATPSVGSLVGAPVGGPSLGAPAGSPVGAPSGLTSSPAPSAPQEQSVQIGGKGPNGGVIGEDAEGNLFEIVNGKKLLLPRPTQNPIQNPPSNPTPPQTSGADSYYSRRRRYSGPFELFGRAG